MTGVVTLVYPGPFATAQLERLALDRYGGAVRHLLQETLPREVTAREYATVLFERCGLAELDVSTIVSYCAAGQAARELLAMCARRSGRVPRMVRVNPEFPTLDTLVRTIEAALQRPLPAAAKSSLDGLTLPLFERLEEELAEVLAARVGGSGTVARDLSRMQIDWVVHLVAAARATTGPADTTDEWHLTSADHACDADCPARHLVVCADADDVFSAPGVVETIQGDRRPGA